MKLTDFLNTYLVTVCAIAALVVLTAMDKISGTVTVPLIVGLTGVHLGSNLTLGPSTGPIQSLKVRIVPTDTEAPTP